MAYQSITIGQRRALRKYVNSKSPRAKLLDAQKWFETNYGKRIGISTISKSLLKQFESIDTEDVFNSNAMKRRAGKWPTLEAALLRWQLSRVGQGMRVSGDQMIEKAKTFWNNIAEYEGEATPLFSEKWLRGFKERHGLMKRSPFGEARASPKVTENQMQYVRDVCKGYAPEVIYSMDETGLYYRGRSVPEFVGKVAPGTKIDTSRVTLVLCCNATGSDRLKPIIINKYRKPHGYQPRNPAYLWKWNDDAWMTVEIMKSWLESFYKHVRGKDVMLLLNNHVCHRLAIEEMPPPENVAINYLPPNSALTIQPLSQGIIPIFKIYYKKKLNEFEAIHRGADSSLNKVNIFDAADWITKIWLEEVKPETIIQCFERSTVLGVFEYISPAICDPDADENELLRKTAQAYDAKQQITWQDIFDPKENDRIRDPAIEFNLEMFLAARKQCEIDEEEATMMTEKADTELEFAGRSLAHGETDDSNVDVEMLRAHEAGAHDGYLNGNEVETAIAKSASQKQKAISEEGRQTMIQLADLLNSCDGKDWLPKLLVTLMQTSVRKALKRPPSVECEMNLDPSHQSMA